MGHITFSSISTFWRALDDIRDLLTQEAALPGPLDSPEHQAIRGTISDMLGLLSDQLELVPAPLAETRRKLLTQFVQTHGLALPTPEPEGDGPWRLEDFPPQRLPGTSLVTCCKNRNENLIRALPSWIAQGELSEILIVDWCSDRPVAQEIAEAGITDPRIRVVRAEDEPRWILSYAFNLGFRMARYDKILKADADIVLAPDFFARNSLPPASFIAGNWRRAGQGQSFVNGFFYIHHADLMAVNGFNEHITTYGWDDDELYDRLTGASIMRLDVADDTIQHLDHDDDARMDERPDTRASGWDDLRALPLYKIRTNRFISTVMPGWDANRTLLPFDILSRSGPQVTLRRRGWTPHPVPAHIRDTAERLAAYELVSWRAGLRTWELPPEALERLLYLRRLDAITRLHVELALAGAPEAAIRSDRHLIVPLSAQTPAETTGRLAALAAAADRALVLRTEAGTLPPGAPEDAVSLAQWVPLESGVEVAAASLTRSDERPVLSLSESALADLPDRAMAAPALQNTPDRLYVDAQHGLGNRLRAIGSGAAVSRATGREMVVVWEPDHHCEARLSDLFDYGGPVLEEAFLDTARDSGQTVLNYMEIEDASDKGALLELEDGRDAYVRTAYVITHPASEWSTENTFLQGLTPSAPVRDLMARVPDHRDIGLHIRMEGAPGTDQNSYDARENWTEEGHAAIHEWRSKSHYSRFIERLGPLLQEQPAARLYLAADMPVTYDAFRQAYGDRVTYLERGLYDRSAAQLHYALADILLLSRCRFFLGSNWSSFSELALRMSKTIRGHEMSGVDF